MLKSIVQTAKLVKSYHISAASSLVKLTLLDLAGTSTEVECEEGDRIFDIARENDVDFEGACGGNTVCGTCHCHIEPGFAEAFEEREDQEEDVLDFVEEFDEELSRLACCIYVNDMMDGMKVEFKA